MQLHSMQDPEILKADIHELGDRFWSKVQILSKDECWEWQACKTDRGYGYFKVAGVMVGAHRLSWEYSSASGRSIEPRPQS